VTSINRSRSDAKTKFCRTINASILLPGEESAEESEASSLNEEAGNMNVVTSNDALPCAIIGAHVFETRFASPLLAAT